MLLDEPLANLDYKLREEMREELPKCRGARNGGRLRHLRAARGAAARRPHRDHAGGPRDAVRPDRRGLPPAGDDRHRPGVLRPPDQHRRGLEEGRDDRARRARALAGGGRPPICRTGTTPWPFGRITSRRRGRPRSRPARGQGSADRAPGSESVAHFEFGERIWVAQSHGVHPYRIGERQTFWLDPAGHLYFDRNGLAVA